MIAFGVVCLLLLAYIAWQEEGRKRERVSDHEAFAREREAWVRERRDLNNRIQIPEAAPFMVGEEDPDAGRDDIPGLPDFEMDETALEEAKRELEKVGYEQGPAL